MVLLSGSHASAAAVCAVFGGGAANDLAFESVYSRQSQVSVAD